MKSRWIIVGTVFLLLAAVISGDASARGKKKKKQAADEQDAEQFKVVDCLLPGQLRKLGRRSTYLTPRRPVRTTGSDCEIRGGEYTSFDRADYATALKIWLAQAQEGDAKAQTYVGEIFEKGLGITPDFEAAATWYRKAADQKHSAAQINLGHLYEKGLGVAKDPQEALRWYRAAAGLDAETLVLDATTDGGGVSRSEVEQLQAELKGLRAERERLEKNLSGARSNLTATRKRVDNLAREAEVDREQLAKLKNSEQATEEVAALREKLQQDESRLAQQRQEIERLNVQVSSYEAEASTASSREQELETQRAAAEAFQIELMATRKKLDESQQDLLDRSMRMKKLESELVAARDQLSSPNESASRITELENALKSLTQDLLAEKEQRAETEQVTAKQRQRLRELENQEQLRIREDQVLLASGSIAPPAIELIDPPLVAQRGPIMVRTRSGVTERVLIGRVTAPAGLRTFFINDEPLEVEASGIFESTVPVNPSSPAVTMVAVDRQGKRAELVFQLLPEGTLGTPPAPAPKPAESSLDFGSYYLLAIGNDEYKEWSDLKTPINDAESVAELLTSRYGFKSRVLRNATRYDILKALNDIRKEMDEKSNLVIYYAGHGYMESEIQRGYWIPVDGELDSNANWISTVDITDATSIMSAKHVLVVADSCYSGTLTRSSVPRLETGASDEALKSWRAKMIEKKVRTALTSGGLEPVMDEGGGDHSVFAKALIDVLSENGAVLETQQLFRQVSARVSWVAEKYRFDQAPQYLPLKHGGHEGGDFFFVPKSDLSALPATAPQFAD